MKKQSPWVIGGIVLAVGLGLTGLLMGLLLPGSWVPPDTAPTTSSGGVQALRKKMDDQSAKRAVLRLQGFGMSLDGNSHRVFVSRPLVYLPKDPEPVQPINDRQITEDGIQVGWKIKNQFDPEDSSIAAEDTDSDGFTNKEEYEKGTNPRDPLSSPAKWVKIRIVSVDSTTLGIGLSGKASDRFSLRFQYVGKKKDYDVMVGDKLWIAAGSKGVLISKSAEEANKVIESGTCPHVIPISILGYHENKGRRLDEKTKTENDFDDSYLEVQRSDGVGGVYKITIDEGGKSRGVTWAVGDILLISLVPGEGKMGPYRVGQAFFYAGREFVIREASNSRVSLLLRPGGEEVDILPKTP